MSLLAPLLLSNLSLLSFLPASAFLASLVVALPLEELCWVLSAVLPLGPLHCCLLLLFGLS